MQMAYHWLGPQKRHVLKHHNDHIKLVESGPFWFALGMKHGFNPLFFVSQTCCMSVCVWHVGGERWGSRAKDVPKPCWWVIWQWASDRSNPTSVPLIHRISPQTSVVRSFWIIGYHPIPYLLSILGWLYIHKGVWAGTSFKSNGSQKNKGFVLGVMTMIHWCPLPYYILISSGGEVRDRCAEKSWKRIAWWSSTSSPRYFEVDDVRFQEGEFTVSIIRWCAFPGSFPLKLWISETYEFIMYINIVGQYPCPTLGMIFSMNSKSIPTLHGTLKKRTSNLIGYDPDPTWMFPKIVVPPNHPI